jgi:hypothetical protein
MFQQHINDIPIRETHRFIFAEYLHEVLLQEDHFGEPRPNCHVLARVVGPLICARVVSGIFLTCGKKPDGKFTFINNEHSWIRLSGQWLMDVKPVGIMSRGPILVWTKQEYPGSDWYHPLPYKEAPFTIRRKKTIRSVQRLRKKLAQYCQEHPLTTEMSIERFSTLV